MTNKDTFTGGSTGLVVVGGGSRSGVVGSSPGAVYWMDKIDVENK